MYFKAIPLMLRHPVVFVVPLLAAVVDVAIKAMQGVFTDPFGGYGASIFQMVVQIIYLFSFGSAIILANNVWRNAYRGFDDAWEESRRKAGGIILAAIGFQFVIYVAGYLGQLVGNTGQIALEIVAAIFLIFTIPAAAIGGLPGALAISGSFRAVRTNPVAAVILGLVFVALWSFVPVAVGPLVATYLSSNVTIYDLVMALVNAIVLGYLAFPFAKLYDDTAFRGW
jgi:hypothetical protein